MAFKMAGFSAFTKKDKPEPIEGQSNKEYLSQFGTPNKDLPSSIWVDGKGWVNYEPQADGSYIPEFKAIRDKYENES